VATVSVSFTPLPSHVRTARFIAASVARRAGVSENVLDEIRLAVSEACSLAVRVHRAQAPETPVEMRLTDDDQFQVQVVDSVARSKPADGLDGVLDLEADDDPGDSGSPGHRSGVLAADGGAALKDLQIDLQARERIGLAVIVGLVDDVEVEYLGSGSVVTMRWPLSPQAPVDVRPDGNNLF
jgi:serine/threonine-protein kinase RsbW